METTLYKKRNTVFGQQDSLQRLLVYLVLFFIIGFILLMIVRSLAYIGFGTMDDIQIQNLLNGSKGASGGFCIYLNVILGSFIAFLYNTLPSVNWYAIFLLAVLLFSCSQIAAVLAQRLGGKAGFAAGFAIFPIIYLAVLLNFTFTVIAYVVLAAAFLNIAYAFYLKDKNRRLYLWISAAVLCVVAVMIRQEALYSAIAIGVVWAIFLLIRYKKAALKTAVIIGGILLVSYAFISINTAVYNANPVWNEYSRFNKVITDMMDRPHPTYEQNQANFQKFGWSQNDYNMFYSYNIPDDPKFSIDNLEKIDATYNSQSRYDFRIGDMLSSIFVDFASHSIPLIILFAAAFILALLSSKSKLLSIAVFLFPFLLQAGFVALQRPLERVVVPHYYIALVLMLCLIDAQVLKEKLLKNAGTVKKRLLPLTALVLALGITVFPLYETFSYGLALTQQRKDPFVAANFNQQMDLYKLINSHPDKYYVYSMDQSFYVYNMNFSIFETRPQNYYINSFSLGGWTIRSTYYEDFKTLAGIKSLPRDLIDNDNIYFISAGSLDKYTSYFYEAYGIPVKYENVDNFAGYLVMRIKTAASAAEMGTSYNG